MIYSYKFVQEMAQRQDGTICVLCKDNYVHIRLRDFGFNGYERVVGFESKLAFMITTYFEDFCGEYLTKELLNEINNKSKYKDIWNHVMAQFIVSETYARIIRALANRFPKVKGIKILPMYSKTVQYKNALSAFGTLKNYEHDNRTLLAYFEDYTEDFLFNDGIYIEVSKAVEVDNSKYINKYKEESSGEDRFVMANLWS